MKVSIVQTVQTIVTTTAVGVGGVMVLETSPAQAAVFNFAYTWSDGTQVVGMVEGDLLPDNNTVINKANLMAEVQDATSTIVSDLLDTIEFDGFVRLDGSFIDFDFSNGENGQSLMLDRVSFAFGEAVVTLDGEELIREPINPEAWMMAEKTTTVPEPLTLVGTIAALGLGTVMKRRLLY